MQAPCIPWWSAAGLPAMAVRTTFAAALLLGCASGCGKNYTVTLQCGPRINSAGLPASATTGRGLRVALICLGPKDFQELAQSESLKSSDAKQPWKEITAEAWFNKNAKEFIQRQVVPEAGAIAEVTVGPNSNHPVTLNHPNPSGRDSGILVLADFYRLPKDAEQLPYESRVWIATGGLGRPREFTVEVGETTIRRVGRQ